MTDDADVQRLLERVTQLESALVASEEIQANLVNVAADMPAVEEEHDNRAYVYWIRKLRDKSIEAREAHKRIAQLEMELRYRGQDYAS